MTILKVFAIVYRATQHWNTLFLVSENTQFSMFKWLVSQLPTTSLFFIHDIRHTANSRLYLSQMRMRRGYSAIFVDLYELMHTTASVGRIHISQQYTLYITKWWNSRYVVGFGWSFIQAVVVLPGWNFATIACLYENSILRAKYTFT